MVFPNMCRFCIFQTKGPLRLFIFSVRECTFLSEASCEVFLASNVHLSDVLLRKSYFGAMKGVRN